MKNSLIKRIGTSIIRSLVLFIVFILIALVARFIFNENLFEKEMLSAQTVNIFHSVFLLLIFESTVFAFNRYATSAKGIFLEKYAHGQRYGKIKSVFLSVEFYTEMICVLIFSLIAPFSFTYECVGISLFGETYSKAKVLALVIPVLIAMEILAHWSVRNAWISDTMQRKSAKEKSDLAKSIKNIIITACVYFSAALVIPWGLPFFITIANFGWGAFVYLYVAIALVIVALLVLLSFYIRAIKKRKEFVAKLVKCCKKHSISLTDIQRPYLSVFFQQPGVDFSLKQGDTVIECKLVAGVFPNSPILFTDRGEGLCQKTLRIFRVDILHLNTLIEYRMETGSEHSKKIVIVLPVPQNIYVSVDGSAPRVADTGEVMGDYTLYTATGFLNALDRGQLNNCTESFVNEG